MLLQDWVIWLKSESFVKKVKEWWSSFSFKKNSNFVLARKLKALKIEKTKENVFPDYSIKHFPISTNENFKLINMLEIF